MVKKVFLPLYRINSLIMKKINTFRLLPILLIGFFCMFAHLTYAQSPIRFGIRAGVNAGTRFGRAILSAPEKTLLGFHAGVFANIELSDDISFCPEVNFSQKGFKTDSSQVTSNYFELPLLLKISMGDGNLYTIIGPYVSYLPTANEKVFSEQAMNFGGTIGLGSRIGSNLLLEGRYSFNSSLGRLNSEYDGGLFRNVALSLSLGYLF